MLAEILLSLKHENNHLYNFKSNTALDNYASTKMAFMHPNLPK